MLNNSLKYIKYLTFVFSSLIVLSFRSIVFAQEDIPAGSDIKLFVATGCQYCEELLDSIAESPEISNLDFDIYDVAESEENSLLFDDYLELCKLTERSVPTLYVNGACFVNSYNAYNKLASIAGIEISDETENDDVDPTTNIDETETSEETENQESFKLSGLLNDGKSDAKIPFYAYLIIPIAITAFIGIAYLLINKMKV